MVYLDLVILNAQSLKNFLHYGQDLSIGNHPVIDSCNVKITLIKLSVSTFGHNRLISPVNFSNVKSFYFWNVCIHTHVSTKRHGKIISQSQFLSSLILELINKFAWFFSIFSSQNFFSLKNRSIKFGTSMLFENRNNRVHYCSSYRHLMRIIISGAFWTFYFYLRLVLCFLIH